MINDDLIILETDRLVIKKIVSTDFRNFLKLHQNITVMKHFDGGAKSLEQAKKKFNEAIQHQQKYGFSYYNVFLKNTNEYIGQTGFFYNYDMTINLCYAFLTNFQNKGYATEAVSELLKYGFEKLKLPLITLMSTTDNSKSIKLAEKMGAKFVKEKILGSGLRVYLYSINKENFYKVLPIIKDYKYRKGVGAILKNRNDNYIYLFQRNDFPNTWQGPEGGIDGNETEENAIYREIQEEIGIDANKLKLIKKSDYYKYNYPNDEIKYDFIGQKKRFFLFDFLGDLTDFNFKNENHLQEFRDARTFTTKDAINLIPEFKKDIYKKIFNEFKLITE